MLIKINPKKIIEQRGTRPRREIVEGAEHKFTEQALYSYEHGHSKPSEKMLPYLLKGLGAKLEDITEEFELALPK